MFKNPVQFSYFIPRNCIALDCIIVTLQDKWQFIYLVTDYMCFYLVLLKDCSISLSVLSVFAVIMLLCVCLMDGIACVLLTPNHRSQDVASSIVLQYEFMPYCTFYSSFEEDFAASTCHDTIVTSWCLVSTNQAHFGRWGWLSQGWTGKTTKTHTTFSRSAINQ